MIFKLPYWHKIFEILKSSGWNWSTPNYAHKFTPSQSFFTNFYHQFPINNKLNFSLIKLIFFCVNERPIKWLAQVYENLFTSFQHNFQKFFFENSWPNFWKLIKIFSAYLAKKKLYQYQGLVSKERDCGSPSRLTKKIVRSTFYEKFQIFSHWLKFSFCTNGKNKRNSN